MTLRSQYIIRLAQPQAPGGAMVERNKTRRDILKIVNIAMIATQL